MKTNNSDFSIPIMAIDPVVMGMNGPKVYMKREDMIHPFISGNKWRKLKYILVECRELKKTHLVSFGGAWSNHLVALACAGATFKFKTTAFVRGEDVNNPVLTLCKWWGMNLIFVSRENYRNKNELYREYFGKNEEAYFIDEGGKGELAAKGCEEILDSVDGFTHIVCAVGTGTTLAGIARAAMTKGMKAEGICVLKGAEAIDKEIITLAQTGVKIHHGLSRGGYAKTDQELMDFIPFFASATGILLDQVYTGKMVMGVRNLMKEDYFQKQDKILMIHTGGLTGLLSHLNL